MVAETLYVEQTWRSLWSHATYQIITDLQDVPLCECTAVGAGWGMRSVSEPNRALIIHPTAEEREIGDLSLTVLGVGTHIIPRSGQSYPQYLATVTDAVETAARNYL